MMALDEAMSRWCHDLAEQLTSELLALRSRIGDVELAAFAIDCHPWDGGIWLAALTSDEARSDPELDQTEEMAAWSLYDFGTSTSGPMRALEKTMRDSYSKSAASGDAAGAATAYLDACARAVAHPSVAHALATLARSPAFRIIVAHPDTGRDFYPPR